MIAAGSSILGHIVMSEGQASGHRHVKMNGGRSQRGVSKTIARSAGSP